VIAFVTFTPSTEQSSVPDVPLENRKRIVPTLLMLAAPIGKKGCALKAGPVV
jgi:hypothetical protein